MAITFDPSLLGHECTGFTSPNFYNDEDTPPKATAVQRAVSSITGTVPAELTAHSVSSPFTYTVERPAQFKTLGPVNPATGKLGSVPRNVWKFRTRKGVTPLAGQAPVTMIIETTVSVPAGADTADMENIRGAFSFHIGQYVDIGTQLADIMGTGVL